MPDSIPPPVVATAPHSGVVLPVSLDDRWAAWQASERERDAAGRQEIRTALLLMIVAIAFAGAIYLSFGGPQ